MAHKPCPEDQNITLILLNLALTGYQLTGVECTGCF